VTALYKIDTDCKLVRLKTHSIANNVPPNILSV